MIDCDFYSSAKEALNFCGPLIQDEVMIFFDDWDAGIGLADRDLGEKAAFDEFLREHPDLSAQEFGTYYHTEMGPRSATREFIEDIPRHSPNVTYERNIYGTCHNTSTISIGQD